jgi:hypothetical protein
LLVAILRCDALCQPMSCVEVLALTNFLIEGKAAQINLMAWKAKHLKNGTFDNSFGTLGWRYWQNFCRRNKNAISSKK